MIDRVASTERTLPARVVEKVTFYAREVPVTAEELRVISDLSSKFAILEQWMGQAYDAMSSSHGTPPDFPEELKDYAKNQKAEARRKARSAKRV